MNSIERVSRSKSFGGWTEVYQHESEACTCAMKFSVFVPPRAETKKVPVLYWLSGLTCTEENFITKAGVQAHAAEHGLLVVAPDTSPRGAGVEGEEESYDLGTGAGFYVNATQAPWLTNYRMYDYVAEELPGLIRKHFPAQPDREGIFGHSMGGHGALTIALKNPGRFRSVSAFSPICAPTQCPWGEKALGHYLGDDREAWKAHDASCLAAQAESAPPILVDQGTDDQFLVEQLHPHLLEEACKQSGLELTLNRREGYDHSYFFIASFMAEHVAFHAGRLLD